MIMAMMKSSNTEWLGDIPAEWDVAQIGNYYELRNEKVSDYDFEPLSVTMKGIVPQLATAAKSDDHSNRKLVKKGDFVINSRSDRRGSCGISPLDGSVSLINIVMKPRGEMNPQYYNWLFHTEQFADEFYKWGHGIVDDLWTTRWQEMKKILIVAPSPDEQQAIADYLDETCSKIDEIIAEAKASIDEYKELKQSVIFEAVTKGLDKNVEMKDSGIEWIGEIPKNWTLYRLKHLLQSPMQYGANATGLEYDKTMPRYVRITDIDSNGNLKDVGKQSLSWDVAEPYLLEDGDLLLARSGGTVGKAFLYKKSYGTCAFAGYLIRAKANDKVLPEYIHYYTLSKGYEIWKNGIFIKATIQNIGADKYANLPIPIPTDIEIQREVVKYLDSKCNTLDSLIAEKESLINDLEAYKKSLIYEVVTGKRRVV